MDNYETALKIVLDAHREFAESNGAKGRKFVAANANLRFADLRGADLSWADMTGTNLSWVEGDGANVTGSSLPPNPRDRGRSR